MSINGTNCAKTKYTTDDSISCSSNSKSVDISETNLQQSRNAQDNNASESLTNKQQSTAIQSSTLVGVDFPKMNVTTSEHIYYCDGIYVKPWSMNPKRKSKADYKKMIQDKSLFALYKCMDFNCCFTTNDSGNMLIHLQNHEQDITHQFCNICSVKVHNWLDCAYCDKVHNSCSLLMEHIQKEHLSYIFQCSYCFYRSSYTNDVDLHLGRYHQSLPKSMVICHENANSEILLPSVDPKMSEPETIFDVFSKSHSPMELSLSSHVSNEFANAILTQEEMIALLEEDVKLPTTDVVGFSNLEDNLSESIEFELNSNREQLPASNAREKISTMQVIVGPYISSKVSSAPPIWSKLQDNLQDVEDAANNLIQETGLVGYHLYRCGFENCFERYNDTFAMQAHLLVHNQSQMEFKCYHCSTACKTVIKFMHHIETHGVHRFFCCYCQYTDATLHKVWKHMMNTHDIIGVNLTQLNQKKSDENKNLFVVFPTKILDLSWFGAKLIKRNQAKLMR